MPPLDTESISGFNLIDIIVSVAIVGVLAAIAVPHFTKHKLDETEAKLHITKTVKEAQAHRLEFGEFPKSSNQSAKWLFTVSPIDTDKAIATATPKTGEGRSLTVLLTPGASQFCWAQTVDVSLSHCQPQAIPME